MVTTKDFANLFGRKIGEEYLLADKNCVYPQKYRFTEYGLECFSHRNGWKEHNLSVNALIGKRIVKECWKPKNGDIYYTVRDNGIHKVVWAGSLGDYMNWVCQNCFTTEEDAQENAGAIRIWVKSMYEEKNGPLVELDLKQVARMISAECGTWSKCEDCCFYDEFHSNSSSCILNTLPKDWEIRRMKQKR